MRVHDLLAEYDRFLAYTEDLWCDLAPLDAPVSDLIIEIESYFMVGVPTAVTGVAPPRTCMGHEVGR